mmetsp:Transcript_147351/g.471083  ORF Transcript_147351/g.471083 Transcript_147351/m.471083 type:complete len:1069 (-) Transcript_147351:390-3596(-)
MSAATGSAMQHSMSAHAAAMSQPSYGGMAGHLGSGGPNSPSQGNRATSPGSGGMGAWHSLGHAASAAPPSPSHGGSGGWHLPSNSAASASTAPAPAGPACPTGPPAARGPAAGSAPGPPRPPSPTQGFGGGCAGALGGSCGSMQAHSGSIPAHSACGSIPPHSGSMPPHSACGLMPPHSEPVGGYDESQMILEGAAARRQAEWERQIMSIDQKEKEVHQTQLRLIREQTAAFIRDLSALRQEVGALRNTHPTHQDLASKHEATSREHTQRVEAIKGFIEKTNTDTHISHAMLHEKVQSLEREHGDRAARLERKCGELGEHVSRHMQLHEEGSEMIMRHGEELAERRHEHSRLEDIAHQERSDRVNSHGNLSDQIMTLEESLRADVQELKQSLGSERAARASLEETVRGLVDVKTSHQTCRAQHAALSTRVDYLEQALGQTGERHSEEIQDARNNADLLHGKMAERDRNHASIVKRMEQVERGHSETVERHRGALEATHSQIDELHGRLQQHQTAMKEKEVHHVATVARMECLEKGLSEHANRHIKELDRTQSHLNDLHGRVENGSIPAIVERLEKLEQTLRNQVGATENARSRQNSDGHEVNSLADRIAGLEEAHEQHGQQLEAAHAKIGELHDNVKARRPGSPMAGSGGGSAQQGGDPTSGAGRKPSIEERLDFVEKALGDATMKHVQWMDLANSAHAELAIVHGRMTAEIAAREDGHAALDDRITKEREFLKERVDYLERVVNEEHCRIWQGIDGQHRDPRAHIFSDFRSSNGEMTDRGGVSMDVPAPEPNVYTKPGALVESSQPHGAQLLPNGAHRAPSPSRSQGNMHMGHPGAASPPIPPGDRLASVGVYTAPHAVAPGQLQHQSSQGSLVARPPQAPYQQQQPQQQVSHQPQPPNQWQPSQKTVTAVVARPGQHWQGPPPKAPMVAQQVPAKAWQAQPPAIGWSMTATTPGHGPPPLSQSQSRPGSLFDALDADHDGVLTRAEFNAAMQAKVGTPLPPPPHGSPPSGGYSRSGTPMWAGPFVASGAPLPGAGGPPGRPPAPHMQSPMSHVRDPLATPVQRSRS